jgi:N-formylglutamate amidohydrolase
MLRASLSDGERADLLRQYYHPHHERLEKAVGRELARTGRALIIDCHSYPAKALPFEDPAMRRPEICVGTDDYHTPPWLGEKCMRLFEQRGYDVAPNTPFKGALVPIRWYGSEPLVLSVMIEVRRDLYMDESTGERLPRFAAVKGDLREILDELGRK